MCRDWLTNDKHNTEYITFLVDKLNEMHITARTLGSIMYLALVANKHYDDKGVIQFRKNGIQHYHSLFFAHKLLTRAQKDSGFKVPGLPEGKQSMSTCRLIIHIDPKMTT